MPILKHFRTNVRLSDVSGMRQRNFKNVTSLTTDSETGILRITTTDEDSVDGQNFSMDKWFVAEIRVVGMINCSKCDRTFEWSDHYGIEICMLCQMELWKSQDPSMIADEPGDHATQPCQTVEIRS
jgi:hypothetical protein